MDSVRFGSPGDRVQVKCEARQKKIKPWGRRKGGEKKYPGVVGGGKAGCTGDGHPTIQSYIHFCGLHLILTVTTLLRRTRTLV